MKELHVFFKRGNDEVAKLTDNNTLQAGDLVTIAEYDIRSEQGQPKFSDVAASEQNGLVGKKAADLVEGTLLKGAANKIVADIEKAKEEAAAKIAWDKKVKTVKKFFKKLPDNTFTYMPVIASAAFGFQAATPAFAASILANAPAVVLSATPYGQAILAGVAVAGAMYGYKKYAHKTVKAYVDMRPVASIASAAFLAHLLANDVRITAAVAAASAIYAYADFEKIKDGAAYAKANPGKTFSSLVSHSAFPALAATLAYNCSNISQFVTPALASVGATHPVAAVAVTVGGAALVAFGVQSLAKTYGADKYDTAMTKGNTFFKAYAPEVVAKHTPTVGTLVKSATVAYIADVAVQALVTENVYARCALAAISAVVASAPEAKAHFSPAVQTI